MKKLYFKYFLTLLFFLTGFTAYSQAPVFEINNIKQPCNGLANGSFEVLVTGGDPDFSLFVFGSRGGAPISNLKITQGEPFLVDLMSPGGILVVVSNTANQASSQVLSLVATSQVSIDDAQLVNNSCENATADGSITLTVSGGTGNYKYSLDGGSTFVPHPIANLGSGEYTVSVFDEGTNCSEEVTLTIENEINISTTNPAPLCSSDESLNLLGYVTPSVAGGNFVFTGEGVSGNSFDPSAIAISGASSIVTVNVVYDVNGCSDSGTIDIEVKQAPGKPTVAPLTAVCQGAVAPAITVGGENVLIYKDAALTTQLGSGNSFDPNTDPAFSTASAQTYTYYATQQVGACPSVASSFEVEVLANPAAPAITGNATVCEAQSGLVYEVPLTAGSSYSWTVPEGANILSGTTGPENNQIIVTFGDKGGEISVIETNSANCSSAAGTFAVALTAKPELYTLAAVGATSFCEGEAGPELQLDGSKTGTSYALYLNGTRIKTEVGTDGVLSFGNFNEAGTYEVTAFVSGFSGCTEQMNGSVSLTVNPLPLAPQLQAAVNPVCMGGAASPVLLTGENIAVYNDASLSNLVGSGNSFDPKSDPAFSTSAPGTFTYYATQEVNGCPGEALPFSVEILANPTAVFGGPKEYCVGESASVAVEFTGVQPFELSYSIDGGTAQTVSGIASNTYSIDLGTPSTDADIAVKLLGVKDGSCSASLTESATVVINSSVAPKNLLLSSSDADNVLCADEEITFTATADYVGANAVYSWYKNAAATPVQQGSSNRFTFTPVVGDEVYVVVTQGDDVACGTGASLTSEVQVINVNSPVAVLSATPAAVCEGESTTLKFEISGSNAAPFTIEYSDGSTTFTEVAASNVLEISVSPTATTTYSLLSIADNNGCAKPVTGQSVAVTVNQKVGPVISSITPSASKVCAGTSVSFSASVSNEGANPAYEWYVNAEATPRGSAETFTLENPADNDQVYLVLKQGSLACGTGGSATSEKATIKVETLDASFLGATAFCVAEGPQTYTATTAGGTFTATKEGVDVSAEISSTGEFTPTQEGNYLLTYTVNSADVAGCSDSKSLTVQVTNIDELAVSLSAPTSAEACGGENSFAFTADITNGGDNPTISWFVDGVEQAGETGTSFTAINLAPRATDYVVTVKVVQDATTLSCGNGAEVEKSQTIKVNENPTAVFASPKEYCVGESASVAVEFTGVQPFELSYSIDGGTAQTVSGIASNTYSIDLGTPSTDADFAVKLLGVKDGSCSASLTESATVVINSSVAPKNLLLSSSDADNVLCADEEITFTATADYVGANAVYSWYKNAAATPVQQGSSNRFTFTPVVGDEVYVVVTQGDDVACGTGASLTSEVQVINVNSPVAVLSATPAAVCEGESTTLKFEISGSNAAPFTIEYSDGSTTFTEVAASNVLEISVSPTATTTYSLLSIADNNGCAKPVTGQSVAVTVNQKVGPVISSITPSASKVCAGTSVSFSASVSNEGANPAYEWYVNAEATPRGSAETFTLENPADNDQVYLVLKQGSLACGTGGSATSEKATIKVETLDASFSGATAFCVAEGPQTYTATTAGGTFTATKEGVDVSAEISSTGEFTPTQEGNYLLTYTVNSADVAGCSDSKSLTVQVTNIDELAVSLSAPAGAEACGGENSFAFTADITNGGDNPTISWFVDGVEQAGEVTENFTVTNLAPRATDYVVTVKVVQDATTLSCGNGATVEQSQNIKVYETPVATLEDADLSICPGEEVVLNFSFTGRAPFDFTYTDGTENYLVEGVTESSYEVRLQPTAGVEYSLESFADASGCTAAPVSGLVKVQVGELPPAPGLSATSATVCAADGVETYPAFTATGTKLKWYLGSVAAENLVFEGATYTPEETAANSYTYYVTQTNDCGTSEAGTISFTVSDAADCTPTGPVCPNAPVVDLGTDIIRCAPAAVILDAGYNTTEYSFVWSQDGNVISEATANTLSVDASDTYSVQVTHLESGCFATDEVVVAIEESLSPVASIEGPETMNCGEALELTASVDVLGENPSYQWFRNDVLLEGEIGSTLTLTEYANNDEIKVAVNADLACVAGAATAIYTISKPEAVLASNEVEICPGEEVVLNFSFTGRAPFDFTYTDGTENYLVEGVTESSYEVRLQPTASAEYSLVSFADASGCTAAPVSGLVKVQVNAAPAAPALSANSATVCAGDEVATYPAFTATGTNLKWYLESMAVENLVFEGSSYTPEVTTAGSYTYFVTQTNDCGTSEAGTISFTVSDAADCTPTGPVCENAPLVDLGGDIIRCAPAELTPGCRKQHNRI